MSRCELEEHRCEYSWGRGGTSQGKAAARARADRTREPPAATRGEQVPEAQTVGGSEGETGLDGQVGPVPRACG